MNISVIKKLAIIIVIFAVYLWAVGFSLDLYDDIITKIRKSIEVSFFTFLFSVVFLSLFNKKYTYIAISYFIILILIIVAERLNYGGVAFKTILYYFILITSLELSTIFLYQKVKKYKALVASSIAFLVYIIPLSFLVYNVNFRSPVATDTVQALLQTNISESYEFISTFISTGAIAFFILFIVVITLFFYKQSGKGDSSLNISKKYLILLSLLLFVSLYHYSNLRIYELTINGNYRYQKELSLFKEMQSKRKVSLIEFNATKKEQGETYIVVIGESLNKKHMGLYDYSRDTTPLLSKMDNKKELMVFNNVYSNHTHTVPVMQFALTEANQYNKKSYYKSQSIIEILNKADVETYWLTNQSIYGAWDNMVSVIATTADNVFSLNRSIGKQTKTQKFDEGLITKVREILDKKTQKNRVIFVHLMGSHTQYKERYPRDKYNIFTEGLKQGEFGKVASTRSVRINHYDNSVIYNDFVVSSIIESLKSDTGKIKGFIYLSDHADDVLGGLGHNSGRFTYYMAQIPMITWFNDGYKEKYVQKYNNLLDRKAALYTNDMLYDTLIGMFGIETEKYNSKYDFSSSNYQLTSQEALVLHGRNKVTDKRNLIYWQNENTNYLVKSNQSSRIIPHRVNSIGKLKDIWRDGFRSFEVDVRFGDGGSNSFVVGHNDGVMGTNLEVFLDSIDNQKIERVWIDLKNLTSDNHKEVLVEFNRLNLKYNFKKKLIIESENKNTFFKLFSEDGWHTSYYLPTNTVIELLKNGDSELMNILSTDIAHQSQLQKLSAVSFHHKLYPFVKKYLEPKISKEIAYHTWYAPDLYRHDFQDRLLKDELFPDKRIKTLLAPYRSQYDL